MAFLQSHDCCPFLHSFSSINAAEKMNTNFLLTKISFVVCFLLPAFIAPAQNTPAAIQVNQVGFYPNAPKVAVVTVEATSPDFFVIGWQSKDTVLRGKLSEKIQSANSSIITRIADFSSLKKTGTYQVAIPGSHSSYPFVIKEKVLAEVAIAVLKSYYFQRVSMPLDEEYAGKWKRPAGQPDTAVIIHPSAVSEKRPAGTVISTPGGWYDAGDYNKYIVNSGITMATMFAAYEDYEVYYRQLKTGIPGSNNRLPDILDELLVNLRWMLTMQDPADGGVYNKCTNASFDGMVMPGVTTAPRYLVQKGTAATLDFAAVTAQAARIFSQFKSQLPGFSDSCLQAATSAWRWAEANPAMQYDQQAINKKYQPQISTGGYGDRNYDDEFFLASCELFVTTKDTRYLSLLKQQLNRPIRIPSWNQVALPGLYTLLRLKPNMDAETSALLKDVQKRLLAFADTLANGVNGNAFRTVMGRLSSDFNWGSNSNAANQGVLLINAFLLSNNKKYMDAALSNIDYILGRNATGYCFVTGTGTRSPMNPHHRPSVSDSITEPVPGFVVGGPNPGQQDKCTYAFKEPETSYTDVACSYASNEIAINWNAPLVYLLNAFEALQSKVGYSK